ncbi:hypothetical protein [Vibrio sp. ER1A]|uniref:hypothetical protein n=1 Tax=Vibrio sp. ER1A TaxID=1517681 RepID=UPI0004DCF2FB|nr:hypothetical protein [Vibrio sp. ER1A]KFA99438.1 hypothetical protein HW45_03490 [Vibrio sp. ER1A]
MDLIAKKVGTSKRAERIKRKLTHAKDTKFSTNWKVFSREPSKSKREEIEVKSEAYGDGWFDGFNYAESLYLKRAEENHSGYADVDIVGLSEDAQEAYRLVNLKCAGLEDDDE